jgi:hypothetical protein
VAALVTLFLLAGSTRALGIEYHFGMDGAQEVPPVPTPATGDCDVELLGNDVTVSCTYEGLIGTPTASHIHAPAPPGQNAGVILGLTVTGGSNGTITGGGTLSPENTQHLLDGNAYVNLHSTFRAGGEIRGQIVPEPAGLALILVGAAAVLRRRRGA